jgi:hypothetical protein
MLVAGLVEVGVQEQLEQAVLAVAVMAEITIPLLVEMELQILAAVLVAVVEVELTVETVVLEL